MQKADGIGEVKCQAYAWRDTAKGQMPGCFAASPRPEGAATGLCSGKAVGLRAVSLVCVTTSIAGSIQKQQWYLAPEYIYKLD